MDRLRREPEVPHDRDASPNQPSDRLDDRSTALDLDRLCAALLDEATSIAQRLLRRHLEGQERHVGHDERPANSPGDGPGVVEHIGERDRDRRLVTQHGVAERVADQDDRDTGLVSEPRSRIVVGRDHHDPFAASLHRDQIGNGDPLRHRGTSSPCCPSANHWASA
ncbi:hypothetical protein HRbin27_01793 [bacterium HR27]|nr:hypothetical protein HRbin27_01793 [bacterium HR27]